MPTQDLTSAQKARIAIQSFKTIVDALALRGFYRPFGKTGQLLADHLINLGPEIYGSMNDPRIIELHGLEYVIDRLPRGIEQCTRIILTEEEEFTDTPFERIIPLRRRRTCLRISEKELCFVITRGLSEIYDILTHLTFLYSEARKIYRTMKDEPGNKTIEWNELEKNVQNVDSLTGQELDQAIWNLSIIIGRSYHETRQSYEYFEKNRKEANSNNSLFSIIYSLGNLIADEEASSDNAIMIYFKPSLMNIIGHQQYGTLWADDIKAKLKALNLDTRPLHIISANLHSIVNLIYGYAALKAGTSEDPDINLYDFMKKIIDRYHEVVDYARNHGFHEIPDQSGTHIDCQLIDTSYLESVTFHPEVAIDISRIRTTKPVLLVMDYAFGTQAFEAMDSLLNPFSEQNSVSPLNVLSISVMGKAGILPGKKGDIMLPSSHVVDGTAENYIFQNDLQKKDFEESTDVYVGPIVTVLGTSLQNRDMLQRFLSEWNTVGLEMEGGYYHRAINVAIIKGYISPDVKVRYAYYASDNPLQSGQTLATGPMGEAGVKPTYMITKAMLERIFQHIPCSLQHPK
jgi:hypothetical protein